MPKNSRQKPLSAELDFELVDSFCGQTDANGFKQKSALRGAVQLWLSLPPALQAHILSDECEEDVLGSVIKYIVRNRIDALRANLRETLESRGATSEDLSQPTTV